MDSADGIVPIGNHRFSHSQTDLPNFSHLKSTCFVVSHPLVGHPSTCRESGPRCRALSLRPWNHSWTKMRNACQGGSCSVKYAGCSKLSDATHTKQTSTTHVMLLHDFLHLLVSSPLHPCLYSFLFYYRIYRPSFSSRHFVLDSFLPFCRSLRPKIARRVLGCSSC